MSRAVRIIISALLIVVAILLFTVWRNVMDEYGTYVAIGFALLAIFLSVAPSQPADPDDKRPD